MELTVVQGITELRCTSIEVLSAAVHRAYCDELIKQGREAFWTGGDYDKLDEDVKEFDRATVRAVLKELGHLKELPE